MTDSTRFQFSDGTEVTRGDRSGPKMRTLARGFLKQKHKRGFVGTVNIMVGSYLFSCVEIDDSGLTREC